MSVKLKRIYFALARAVEEGDHLKLGIVIGQTLKELEELINETYDSDSIQSTTTNNQPRSSRGKAI